MLSKKKIIVYDLNDFICRCGSNQLEKIKNEKITTTAKHRGYFKKLKHSDSGDATFKLRCLSCGRTYLVNKHTKKMRISNLPMSFGFRSMYWEEINIEEDGLTGKIDEYYEIKEESQEKNI